MWTLKESFRGEVAKESTLRPAAGVEPQVGGQHPEPCSVDVGNEHMDKNQGPRAEFLPQM